MEPLPQGPQQRETMSLEGMEGVDSYRADA